MADFFSDTTSKVLGKCLDGVGVRHRVIANNLANVETPGFTSSEVSFESELTEVLTSARGSYAEKLIDAVEPEVQPDALTPAGPNGNNVSVDKEMAEMSKNTMQYEALVQLLSLKGMMIRAAITEGRR